MIKIIISDLDGTILPRRQNTVSISNIQALVDAGTQGLLRVIATGRSLYSFQQLIPNDFPIDYLIFSSGAGMLHWPSKTIIQTHNLSPQDTQYITTYLWKLRVNFTIHEAIPHTHHFYYTQFTPKHEDFLRRIHNCMNFGRPLFQDTPIDFPATQFILILGQDQIAFYERIRQDLTNYSVIRTTSPIDNKAIWVEIFPHNVNKGNACIELLHRLNLSSNSCAGLGNDYNDLDFLAICGHPYLVDNAHVFPSIDYPRVAPDYADGLAHFISTIHAINHAHP